MRTIDKLHRKAKRHIPIWEDRKFKAEREETNRYLSGLTVYELSELFDGKEVADQRLPDLVRSQLYLHVCWEYRQNSDEWKKIIKGIPIENLKELYFAFENGTHTRERFNKIWTVAGGREVQVNEWGDFRNKRLNWGEGNKRLRWGMEFKQGEK